VKAIVIDPEYAHRGSYREYEALMKKLKKSKVLSINDAKEARESLAIYKPKSKK
jgi:hypothetical protein